MQKCKKKDLVRVVSSLEEYNDNIVRNLKKMNEHMIDELTKCQQLAIEIGTELEKYEDRGADIVKILEMYCEDIYQMSLCLNDSNQCRKIAKRIQKQLSKVKNGIKNQVPSDKKEVVFLPYKASMWDSLESIWKAAMEDSDCEVYVIPIPYFEKRPDGTIGTMNYEGNQYPREVKITDWQEYNLADRKPDIIYIHNPYDNCNIVTTVHPAFYSEKLKNYTNMLVYVPYFVAATNDVKKYCILPGTLYADYVVVQSDAIRDIYIQEYHKFEKEKQCKNVFGRAEDKFVALGSPKLDRVNQLKDEDFDIPKEWKDVIEILE